jgi:hypothetical protein
MLLPSPPVPPPLPPPPTQPPPAPPTANQIDWAAVVLQHSCALHCSLAVQLLAQLVEQIPSQQSSPLAVSQSAELWQVLGQDMKSVFRQMPSAAIRSSVLPNVVQQVSPAPVSHSPLLEQVAGHWPAGTQMGSSKAVQQVSPLAVSQLPSPEQTRIAACGIAQIFLSDSSVTRTQASPAAVSHSESTSQKRGQAAALTQAVPSPPKSQHSSPDAVSQSVSPPHKRVPDN